MTRRYNPLTIHGMYFYILFLHKVMRRTRTCCIIIVHDHHDDPLATNAIVPGDSSSDFCRKASSSSSDIPLLLCLIFLLLTLGLELRDGDEEEKHGEGPGNGPLDTGSGSRLAWCSAVKASSYKADGASDGTMHAAK